MPNTLEYTTNDRFGADEKGSEKDEVQKDAALASMKPPKLGKHALKLWRDWESHYKRSNLEAKINYFRWRGVKHVQRNPNQRDRIWLPPHPDHWASKSFNEIERAVDRYVSQIFADDPVMEAAPRSQEDEDLDAADAATDAIQAEWLRPGMKVNDKAFETFFDACIFRSAFTHTFWDPRAGGRKPAQMFVTDPETGRETLEYVNGEGDPVDDRSDAKQVWGGNLRCEKLKNFQVRYSPDAEWVHEAAEVTIARLISLRKVYEMYPELKDVELGKLFENRHVDLGGYLADFAADVPKAASEVLKDSDGRMTGSEMNAADRKRLLDKPVFFLVYYRSKDRKYPNGYWCHVFGDGVVPEKGRGTLKKWAGEHTVCEVKCLYDPVAREGRSLVDVLASKQNALDFIETQVMKYLKSMHARWAVNSTSVINREALRDADHNDIVYYDGDAPSTLNPPQMPAAIGSWHEKFKAGFDDAAGMHGPLKGQHVPGVQSGRHVEALQAADQTILSLSRRGLKVFLERQAVVILRGIKGYWTEERQVAFHGRDERYIQKAFSKVDFGDTEDVTLQPGSLLMLTPAQRGTIMSELIEIGVYDQMDLKREFPAKNVGGFALREDPHYQAARREGDAFLEGPPSPLRDAFEQMNETIQEIQTRMDEVLQNQALASAMGQPAEDPEQALAMFDQLIEQVQQQFQAELSRFMPAVNEYEKDAEISLIHFTEHARALSRSRAGRLQRKHVWWWEAFQAHAIEHAQIAQVPGLAPPPQPEQPQGQPQEQPPANPEAQAQQAAAAGAA